MIQSVEPDGERPKVTVAMIAAQCGLSKAAVSYALRGKRGVSEYTRLRVEDAARQLGWRAPTPRRGRARAGFTSVGLLVPQPVEVLTEESFTAQFISGMKATCSEYGVSLLLDFEVDQRAQMEIYRAWSEMRVTKVVLIDVVPDDFRLTLLPRLGLVPVSTCPPSRSDTQPCVFTDDAADMSALLTQLFSDGHRRMAHVSGPSDHPQVERRVKAWHRFFEQHPQAEQSALPTDWVDRRSYAAIAAYLADRRPDAVVFDSDRLALLGMRAVRRLGIARGERASLVSFDDSLLCQAMEMAALRRDSRELGRQTAQVVIGVDDRQRVILPPASLMPRATYRRGTSRRKHLDDVGVVASAFGKTAVVPADHRALGGVTNPRA